MSISYSLLSTVFNDVRSVDACINSLAPQIDPAQGQWILVDAFSDDGTWDRLVNHAVAYHPRLRVYQCRVAGPTLNRGEGRRLAAALARGRILIHSIDTDLVYVSKGAIARILSDFAEHGEVPTAGDGFFVCTAEQYWAAGGHKPIQQEEDFQLYSVFKQMHCGFRTQKLNVWYQHKDNGIVSQTNPTPLVEP